MRKNSNLLRLVQVVLVIAVTCVGESHESDGKPGCRTRYEFSRLWRHGEVNNVFWECTNWRQATARQCPKETFFNEWWQTCVPLQMWEETPFMEPPSSAYDDEDPCEVIDIEPECPINPQPTPKPTDPPTTAPVTSPESTTIETTTTETAPETTPEATTTETAPETTVPTTTPEVTTPTTTESTTTTTTEVTTQNPEDPPDDTTLETSDVPTQSTTESSTTTTTTTQKETTTTEEITPDPTTSAPTETTTKSQFALCPGADESRLTEGDQSCQRPVCNNELYQNKTRLPSLDPGQYYTCINSAVLMTNNCNSPTHCFSFSRQMCVTPDEWFNPCGNVKK
ncbi:salivary glue protein Sgs-3-like [Lutzomyia longipalpis]|uniref:salivary glue protein Sgs-3-like n=1 Tax=Lutzomyia longipalpis TaxID=7200 RepID=UPI0024836F26|nr:salivary glue protein Sgs-3-like [Lutzomyia longipalpis]